MRPRTFILVILVFIVIAALVFLLIARGSLGNLLGGSSPGGADSVGTTDGGIGSADEEPGIPTPEPTPSIRFEPVVVARVDIPVGQRLTSELLEVETRPNMNIALQGGYTFATPEDLIGKIVRVNVAKGQAILNPMIALNATDLSSFGSDLALYIDQGRVAVAFPLRLPSETSFDAAQRGVAFAMRPGDFVDVMMTFRTLDLDPEFGTALPNCTYRVNETSLLEGAEFLFPAAIQGRLEFVPEINQVLEIVPGALADGEGGLCDTAAQPPLPKRITQLTLQQMEVLWVGTWRTQEDLLKEILPTPAPVVAGEEETNPGDGGNIEEEGSTSEEVGPTGRICLSPVTNELVPCPVVRDTNRPDVVILSMTAQDAVTLKWALERGVEMNLVLRAQGDVTVFFTSSVSLPQIVNDGALLIPEPYDVDLDPRVDEVPAPSLPSQAPTN